MGQPASYQSCTICRVLRAFAFSTLGAGVAAYTARWLGADYNTIVVVAFFGALAAVWWSNIKKDKKRD
jgi:Flp pilus assembly protein TadB